MLGCLTATATDSRPPCTSPTGPAGLTWTRHLLLAHDPWTGIGGEDGRVRTSDLPDWASSRGGAPRDPDGTPCGPEGRRADPEGRRADLA
ncbi:hypothetical protein GCM10023238_06570 [Streptomyces heliomycini]